MKVFSQIWFLMLVILIIGITVMLSIQLFGFVWAVIIIAVFVSTVVAGLSI